VEEPEATAESKAEAGPSITIGLIAAPGAPSDLAEQLATDLEARLTKIYPDVEWHLPTVTDGLVDPPAPTTELIDAAHQRLLREDWELALCVTDLPLRIGRRPVIGHASPTHRVVLISVPAVGAGRVRRTALDTAVGLLNIVLGEAPEPTDMEQSDARRLHRRLVNLADLADEDPAHGPTGWAALARGGRLRLLIGMVRANRPWRLTAQLYRALVAALATVAFALVTSDVWRISDRLTSLRLAIITVLSIALTASSLIAAHGLWESSGGGRARDQVLLFNAATAATVAIGIACLYLSLLIVSLAAAGLLITPDSLSAALGSDGGFADYLNLAWLVASLATVGGALGAGLESDVAIHEAAYGYRPENEAVWPAEKT
jgi:hypothetical protein